MTELLQASLQPGALITLMVLVLSIVLFVWGVIAPEVTGLLADPVQNALSVPQPLHFTGDFVGRAIDEELAKHRFRTAQTRHAHPFAVEGKRIAEADAGKPRFAADLLCGQNVE